MNNYFPYVPASNVSLQPRGCICPNEGYTCHVTNATEINWITSTTTGNDLLYTSSGYESSRSESYFRVNYTHIPTVTRLLFDFTSTLFVTNFTANGTNVTCQKIVGGMATDSDTIVICVVGMSIISVRQCLLLC